MSAAGAPADAVRIGWLGGSFDPIHEGHVCIARLAADRLALDRVLLVPAHRPPHKPGRRLAPDADRLALIEIAARADPRLQACDVELRRGGTSYSYDTARDLRDSLPAGAELFYVIGADTLADLPNWHRIADLCRMVTFVTVAREGQALDARPLAPLIGVAAAAEIERRALRVPPHPASSTAVREALARGERPEHLADAVWDEIVRRGLYGAGGRTSSSRRGGDARGTP